MYEEVKSQNAKLFLIFTTRKSNIYSGVAEIISNFNKCLNFDFWWEEIRWKGLFKIQWWYIKDLNYKSVFDIYGIHPEEQYEQWSITDLFDGCEMDEVNGREFLNRYYLSNNKGSIFDNFNEMDENEVTLIRPGRDKVHKVVDKMKRHNIFELFLKKDEFKTDLDFEELYNLENGKKILGWKKNKPPSMFEFHQMQYPVQSNNIYQKKYKIHNISNNEDNTYKKKDHNEEKNINEVKDIREKKNINEVKELDQNEKNNKFIPNLNNHDKDHWRKSKLKRIENEHLLNFSDNKIKFSESFVREGTKKKLLKKL